MLPCPSLLGPWHLQCAAGLELAGDGGPGGHALRSLIGLWSHALNLPAGYASLVARGIGLARVHDSRSERFLPGPYDVCLSPSPVLLRIGLLVLLLCGMSALRSGTYRSPIY